MVFEEKNLYASFPYALQAMLHFIYRDTLVEDVDRTPSCSSLDSHISDVLIAKLLAVSDKYGLARLRQLCECSLCKDISVNTVGEILALADCYHAPELKAVCLRFAAENLAGYLLLSAFHSFYAGSEKFEIIKGYLFLGAPKIFCCPFIFC